MPRRAHPTEDDLAQLERLRERVVVHRALEWAAKEAQLWRDADTTDLVDRVPNIGARVADVLGSSPAWPGKVALGYPEQAREWRAEHPDRLEILREAKGAIERMIREIEGDDGGN